MIGTLNITSEHSSFLRWGAAPQRMPLVCLILCDAVQAGSALGGAGSFLKKCRGLEISHEVIDIAALRDEYVMRI